MSITEYDRETGEPPRRMAPEIAAAVVNVMLEAKQLGFDERNQHGGYNYASIDKFLASLRPLCAKHGLIILLDETGCEFREGPANREGKASSYAFLEYAVWLVHSSGAMHGPITRRLALPATGPQAFGSAESYVMKRFMRNLFQIPTGEKDADELPEGDVPVAGKTHAPPGRYGARQRAEANWGGDGSQEPVPPTQRPSMPVVPQVPHAIDPASPNPGRMLIAGLDAAKTTEEVDQWIDLNGKLVADFQTNNPKAYGFIEKAVARARDRIGTPNVLEDAGEVMS